MPVYQYVCQSCSREFEQLVMGPASPVCPECGSARLERLLSVFAVGHGSAPAGMPAAGGSCGSCGDPRGPGACSLN